MENKTVNENIPDAKKAIPFVVREQYKILRTNLSFTLPEDVKCPVIGISSPLRHEGKSTTAIYLAKALSEEGKRVLVVDGDLRLPTISSKFGIPAVPGLTEILMSHTSKNLNDFQTDINPNLFAIPAGTLPPNPSELLSSGKMERFLNLCTPHFDFIIIDLPPINVVTDALAASKFLTGIILVVMQDQTEKRELDITIRQIRFSNVRLLGFVMNGVRTGLYRYGHYGKYSKYAKYGKYGKKGYYGKYGKYGRNSGMFTQDNSNGDFSVYFQNEEQKKE